MSKQTTRLRTRQERRREDKLRREEGLQRVARNRRIAIISIVTAVVLTVVALVYFVSVQNQTPASAAYPTIDGVTCDSNEHADFHIHAHVTIYIDGQVSLIPATIGIASDTSCLYWLHTHDNNGVIHIEAPNGHAITFGNFLDIWQSRFRQLGYPTQMSDPASWQVYVGGKPFTGNLHTIPMQNHLLITLAYHSPGVKPDTTYDWSGL